MLKMQILGKIESLEVMHILVERGAKINLPDIDGIKPSSIENGLQEMQKVRRFSNC